jgi:hypothetical protein
VSGTEWYVVAREYDGYINTFGPFVSEIDARAFALDLHQPENNGWESVCARLMTHEEAENLATDDILWPYEEQDGEEE